MMVDAMQKKKTARPFGSWLVTGLILFAIGAIIYFVSVPLMRRDLSYVRQHWSQR